MNAERCGSASTREKRRRVRILGGQGDGRPGGSGVHDEGHRDGGLQHHADAISGFRYRIVNGAGWTGSSTVLWAPSQYMYSEEYGPMATQELV